MSATLLRVLADVRRERERQDARWGQQDHEDGTSLGYAAGADEARQAYEEAAAAGRVTWSDILHEEVCEAFAETDPVKLRAELLQVAAVACAWVECIDRRGSQ